MVTGPHSRLPTASRPVHGAQEYQPAGQRNTAQAEQVDSVEEDHSASAADREDGVHQQVVPLQAETGAMPDLGKQANGRPVPGQSGGMETSALPLTGLAGLPELGRLLLHGLLGLLARLRLLRLLSTRLLHPVVTRHTRLPALVTRLLRPLLLALLPRILRLPVALLQSPLQVVPRQQLSWASSPCCDRTKISSPTKRTDLSEWHFPVHSLRWVCG